MRSHSLVALVAAGLVACIEPVDDPDEDRDITARFAADECTVINHGPGVDDGLVGVCHAECDEDGIAYGYRYLRVTPDACRERHARHAFDFRSDDPLCRILPETVHFEDVVTDTVLE